MSVHNLPTVQPPTEGVAPAPEDYPRFSRKQVREALLAGWQMDEEGELWFDEEAFLRELGLK